jgi:hypothetical protein
LRYFVFRFFLSLSLEPHARTAHAAACAYNPFRRVQLYTIRQEITTPLVDPSEGGLDWSWYVNPLEAGPNHRWVQGWNPTRDLFLRRNELLLPILVSVGELLVACSYGGGLCYLPFL